SNSAVRSNDVLLSSFLCNKIAVAVGTTAASPRRRLPSVANSMWVSPRARDSPRRSALPSIAVKSHRRKRTMSPVGAAGQGVCGYYTGLLDEVRPQAIARGPDWVTAE